MNHHCRRYFSNNKIVCWEAANWFVAEPDQSCDGVVLPPGCCSERVDDARIDAVAITRRKARLTGIQTQDCRQLGAQDDRQPLGVDNVLKFRDHNSTTLLKRRRHAVATNRSLDAAADWK